MAVLYRIHTNLFQKHLVGQMASLIFRTVGSGSLSRLAVNGNETCVLGFYKHHHSSGIYEAGIHFGPGTRYRSLEKFPVELLRAFARDQKDLDLLLDHFTEIVEKEGFNYVHVQ